LQIAALLAASLKTAGFIFRGKMVMKNVFLATATVLMMMMMMMMTSGIAFAGNFSSAGSSAVQEKAHSDTFKGAQQKARANGAPTKSAERDGCQAGDAAVIKNERSGRLGVWVSGN
jgi:hypothetical protein